MRSRRVLALVGLVSLVAAAGLAFRSQQSSAIETQIDEAEAKLKVSLLDAPELVGIEAGSALSQLERAVVAGADTPRARGLRDYAGALVKLQTRDLLAASRALEAARASLGDSAELHVLAGTIARARADAESAEREAIAALALDADAPRALLLDADLALDRGDGARAAASLTRIILAEPRVGAIHNRLGLAREQQGDLAGAEQAYRDAIRLHRRDPDPFVNLARLLAARGALGEATRAYATAIEAAPAEPDAYLGRGLLRVLSGELVGAREDLDRAAELAPERAAVRAAQGDLSRAEGELKQAIERYREALRLDDGASLWVKLGNALLSAEQTSEALAAYREAIERDSIAAAHNGEGAALMQLGRSEEAIVALETAAALDPHDPNPLLNLGLYYRRSGDETRAAEAFAQAAARQR